MAPDRPDVFVSYSRADAAFVETLTAALTERGKDVWVDWEDIEPSADWWQRIERGIEAANTFVAVLSPDHAASEVCARELDVAEAHNKRVIPVVHRGVGDAVVSPALARRNWIFARDGDDFDAAVARLVAALETDLDWVDRHAGCSFVRESGNARTGTRASSYEVAISPLRRRGSRRRPRTVKLRPRFRVSTFSRAGGPRRGVSASPSARSS